MRNDPCNRELVPAKELFLPTRLERRKQTKETVAKYVFLAMTLVLVFPLIAILTVLVVKAWPALSPALIWENPQDGKSGIWAPLVGTFFLVLG
jgi:phosphate transport system permease protein